MHVVYVLGAAQGLFLAAVLASRPHASVPNRLLAAVMAVFSVDLAMAAYHASGADAAFPALIGLDYIGTPDLRVEETVPRSIGGYAGIFDMSGNLWEWEDSCATSDGVGDLCRARGGSFWSSELSLRCQGATADHSRSNVNRNLGFRCCSDGD